MRCGWSRSKSHSLKVRRAPDEGVPLPNKQPRIHHFSCRTRCFRMNLPCRKKLTKKAASSGGGGVDPTPIIDLVIEKADPRPFTEIYMQARDMTRCFSALSQCVSVRGRLAPGCRAPAETDSLTKAGFSSNTPDSGSSPPYAHTPNPLPPRPCRPSRSSTTRASSTSTRCCACSASGTRPAPSWTGTSPGASARGWPR